MRTGVIIKLAILFSTLALVIWASVAVREGSMEGFFASFSGVDTSKQINLCRNRIRTIELSSSRRIEETNEDGEMQWKAFDPAPRPLNYLNVEKWLGEHCYVEAAELKESMEKLGPFKDAVKIGFIDGSVASLMQNAANSNVYSWAGRFYESSELTAAIAELRALAGW